MLAPWNVRRYRLTNRRVVVEAGAKFKPQQYADLDHFDRIDIEVRPGQAWYPAGDMVFKLGQVETLRLVGVGLPGSVPRHLHESPSGFRGRAEGSRRERGLRSSGTR